MAGDPYKDDLGAAHARLRSLEQENARLRQRLDGGAPGATPRPRTALKALIVGVGALLAVLLVAFGATMVRVSGGRGAVIVVVAVALLVFAVMALLISRLTYVCGPNEALVLSGRRVVGPDGTVRGYRVVRGGRCVRLPFLERADRVDLTALSLELERSGVVAGDGTTVATRLAATVRAGATPELLHRFVERFLGRPRDEAGRVAAEVLEGGLRDVVAAHDLEALQRDRVLLQQRIAEAVAEQLAALGLTVEQLSVGALRRSGAPS